MFGVDADVSSRVVDVRLHHGGYPREINEKNIAQEQSRQYMYRKPIGLARAISSITPGEEY